MCKDVIAIGLDPHGFGEALKAGAKTSHNGLDYWYDRINGEYVLRSSDQPQAGFLSQSDISIGTLFLSYRESA